MVSRNAGAQRIEARVVAPSARGRGVAAAATVVATAWACQVLGLFRVSLHVDPSHSASRGVAERAGFTFEGVARSAAPATHGPGRVDLAV